MADQGTSSQPTIKERPKGGSRLFILAAGAIVLVATFAIVWLQSSKYEPLVVGKTAPDFTLTDLNDKPHRLSDFRGKVVFLNFWATWCAPCREEMPSMEVLNKSFEKDGLVVLAVSIDRVTTTKDIPPFVKSLNLAGCPRSRQVRRVGLRPHTPLDAFLSFDGCARPRDRVSLCQSSISALRARRRSDRRRSRHPRQNPLNQLRSYALRSLTSSMEVRVFIEPRQSTYIP